MNLRVPSGSETFGSSDTEFQPADHLTKGFLTLQQNRVALPTLAQVCDRFGLSNRARAAAANAPLIDFNVISKEDKSAVIDHHKLARERKRHRQHQSKHEKTNWEETVSSIYFDGKRDATLRSALCW